MKKNIKGIVKANLTDLGLFEIYISEHKVKTAAEAAVLADDYVLIHRGGRDFRVQEEGMYRAADRWEEKAHAHLGNAERVMRGQPRVDPSEICNVCRGRGHWKADCPKANARRGIMGASLTLLLVLYLWYPYLSSLPVS
ncbi:hypothetical protein F7725_003890, partial [Dissostichus mawsoni]